MERPENTRILRDMYRKILMPGMLLVRCNCYIKDKHPGKGYVASHLSLLNLTIVPDWKVLIKCDFNTSLRDANGDGRFSLSTDTHIAATHFDKTKSEDVVMHGIYENFVDDSELRWGSRPLRCSISFASGTDLEDVPRSHWMILPTLTAAYADLKSGFFTYSQQMPGTIGREQAELALDELLKRYSAFVAQATQEQMKNLIGS